MKVEKFYSTRLHLHLKQAGGASPQEQCDDDLVSLEMKQSISPPNNSPLSRWLSRAGQGADMQPEQTRIEKRHRHTFLRHSLHTRVLADGLAPWVDWLVDTKK